MEVLCVVCTALVLTALVAAIVRSCQRAVAAPPVKYDFTYYEDGGTGT